MNSGGNKPEDDHTEDKDTSKNAENTDNKLQRDDQNKDERKKVMNSGGNQLDDEHSDNEGSSQNIENIDSGPQRDGQNKDESTLVEKPSLAEEKAVKYENLIKTLHKLVKDLQLEGNLEEDTSEYKKSTLDEELDLAKEQVDKYDKLIQTLRNFDKDLELQDNLEEDKSKKEKGSKRQHSKTKSDVEYDNDILVKAMSSFNSLIQKIRDTDNERETLSKELEGCKEKQRKTEEEKEKLKTDLANCREDHRKTAEKWKADEKILKQTINEREKNVKERDKSIKSLNAEKEKLTKTLNKTTSSLKGQEEATAALLKKQVELQQQKQFDTKMYQQVVQERERWIQHLNGKLQQMDTNVKNLTQELKKSEEERSYLNLRDTDNERETLSKELEGCKEKQRKTEEEKEKLKTDLANCREDHRKTAEKWKADEKILKQTINEREKNVKERDKSIKSLNAEKEKLTKTLNKTTSSLKGQEEATAALLKKQVELQQQKQFDTKMYQQVVQERERWIQHLNGKLQQMDTDVKNLTQELKKSEEERSYLNLRLSKLAGACLTRENPNITDLSDTNRPTKLAERYSELYDNEWTDAFEELSEQKHTEDVQCIKDLLDLLKATNDECVQLTKPNREILRTLTSVSITLYSNLMYKKQSAGTENHCLAQSTNPNMAIKREEHTYDSRSTIKEQSEQGPEEMEVEYSPAQTEFGPNEDNVQVEIQADAGKLKNGQVMDEYRIQLENSQSAIKNSTNGMHLSSNLESIAKIECESIEDEIQDENQTDNGQPREVKMGEWKNNTSRTVQNYSKMKDKDSTQFEKLQTAQIISKTQCVPIESKGQDETRADNGQPFDAQEPGKQTESDSNEGQCQDEKQSDNGQPSDVQEMKDKAKTIPEGFSSNVDTGEEMKDKVKTIPEGFSSNVNTGEVSTEVVIDVKFSEEQMKTISDMRRLSSILFETEKEISKLIAEKIAFERGIDAKRWVKVMAFITKCAELCWYMAIQEPPVVIEFHEPVDDELFDKDKYKAYTEMGDKLEYVVWPPLYLHSGGAMLCKGTAQGKK